MTNLALRPAVIQPFIRRYPSFTRRPSSVVSLLDDLFGDDVFASSGLPLEGFSIQVDVREEKDAYLLIADLPGVDPNQVTVDLDDQALTITAERQNITQDSADDDKAVRTVHRRERAYGKASRIFHLPADANVGEINARFTHGVLEIKIPKVEDQKTRRTVDIKVA
ncbi:MAG: Hsp20/alpha crystallin family protein [Pseudomonadota bacterium]